MTTPVNKSNDVVLVHSSDLHIDNTDIGAIDGHQGLIGLQAVLATAAAVAADVLLLAGDTFENHRISQPVLRRTAALLADAPLPIILLPGNHDSILPDCMFVRGGLNTVPNLHLLGVTDPDTVLFPEHDME